VAVYPLGTGNVLAKELGLPRRVRAFCEMMGAGRQRALDVASVGGRRFVSMAGVGFDAAVAARLAAARSGGIRMRKYVVPLLRCFATYRFPRLEVRIDDGEAVAAEGFVLVSNVRAYGGPFVVTPDAVHDDGLLDVCVLPRGSRLRALRAMLAFTVGCQRSLSGARYFRGRRVRVTSEERVHYQVDGDAAGFVPATFELLERKQRFVVP
jgi:diacylglycerol kinase family enzyme